MISALAIAALVGGGSCTLVETTQLDLPEGRLMLRQLVDGGCPDLGHVGDTVIAALPRGVDRATLTRLALVALVRRRVPDLVVTEADASSAQLVELRRGASPEPDIGPTCFALSRSVAPGDSISRGDLDPSACAQERTPLALAYDRHNGVLRAAEAGDTGHYVGQLMELPADLIEHNQHLQLRVTSGPVTITRDVIAVQPARMGDAIFVRDADGHVFPAPSVGDGAQP